MKITQIYKKNRLYIQQTGYSCGPCSILNILNLKKKKGQTEKKLMKACRAKPGIGSDTRDLTEAAIGAGLKIVEEKRKGTPRDIDRNLKKGCKVIVLYYHLYADIGHFSVITESDKDAFYFADSSFGFIRIKKKDFAKHWYNTSGKVRGWYLAVK